MSYKSTASLCHTIRVATASWSLLHARHSTPATLTGSEESPTAGAGVAATRHAGAQGCGRLAANTRATGDVSLSKGTSILLS